MATGAGNLYPNWLGTPTAVIPNNSVNTTVNIQGIKSYTTTVNVVPQVLLSSISTAELVTNNPSEVFSYTVPETGWYMTHYNAFAYHTSAGDWSNLSQLDWYVKNNNVLQSNSALIVKPQFICGDSVSEFISLAGQGVFPANAGDVLEWTTDGNTGGGPVITSNYFSGFEFISLQKIG